MIHPNTFRFLEQLKQNNNRDWFDKHRAVYEEARADVLQFTGKLITCISQFDNHIARAGLDPKKCITRLHRDVRFSNDKTPYKTNFFSIISEGGKNSHVACYYIHLAPGESFLGGGAYMPEAPFLLRYRQEIESDFKRWTSVIEHPEFVKAFETGVQTNETLSRPPKGFQPDSPALAFLKMKSFYTVKNIPDEFLFSSSAIGNICGVFQTVSPMIDFLNEAVRS